MICYINKIEFEFTSNIPFHIEMNWIFIELMCYLSKFFNFGKVLLKILNLNPNVWFCWLHSLKFLNLYREAGNVYIWWKIRKTFVNFINDYSQIVCVNSSFIKWSNFKKSLMVVSFLIGIWAMESQSKFLKTLINIVRVWALKIFHISIFLLIEEFGANLYEPIGQHVHFPSRRRFVWISRAPKRSCISIGKWDLVKRSWV